MFWPVSQTESGIWVRILATLTLVVSGITAVVSIVREVLSCILTPFMRECTWRWYRTLSVSTLSVSAEKVVLGEIAALQARSVSRKMHPLHEHCNATYLSATRSRSISIMPAARRLAKVALQPAFYPESGFHIGVQQSADYHVVGW